MAVTASWDDEAKTILRQTFEGRWTWDEFDRVWQQVETMGEGLDSRVDFILDMRKSSLLPTDLLQRAGQVNQSAPDPRVGLTVVVGAGMVAKALWGTFQRAIGRMNPNLKLVFAGSLDEARTIIHKSRAQEGKAP